MGQPKRTMKQILRSSKNKHALFSATATLVLGIMGSAVLVICGAFAETGIGAGFFLLALIAIVNAYTSDLLLRQCRKTGTIDYDTLSYAVGGPFWRFFSQFGIVILLLGTLAGGVSQIGEAFSYGLLKVSTPPEWLTNGSGRVLMVICVLVIVVPLCFLNNLTALDYAGVVGFALVCFLTIWIMIQSIIRSLPAIPDGFDPSGFGSKDGIVNSISTLGFAFYIQPIMLPMLIEMPNGRDGARILSWAVRFTILDALIGFFGAAWFGQDTEGNILQNNLGNDNVQAFINISIALYLALSLPPVVFPTRLVLDAWMPGHIEKLPLLRKMIVIAFITIVMLLVGLLAADSSGQTLAVTGATGVLIVSYLVPIVNHTVLYFGWARCQRRVMEADPFWADALPAASTVEDSAAGFLGRPPPGQHKVITEPQGEYGKTFEGVGGVSPIDPKVAGMEGGEDSLVVLKPLDKMEYRLRYKNRLVEWTVELFWPLAVLTVGMFASISALTIVGND